MAKLKNLAEKALEKSFLLSRLTFEGPVGPPNPFETSPMLILHSFGYGLSEKTQISAIFSLGFFPPQGKLKIAEI